MQLPPLNRISFNTGNHDQEKQFDAWLESEPGQALLDAERTMLEEWMRRQVGQRAVAVYSSREQGLMEDCPLRWKMSLGPAGFPGVTVQSRLDSLPLAKSSVDVLLLHHVLDFTGSPHQVLREACRSIAPGGKIAIVGFHPLSMMGIARWFLWRHRVVYWSC